MILPKKYLLAKLDAAVWAFRALSGLKNAPVVPVEPRVKSAKWPDLSFVHAPPISIIEKSADPVCYDSQIVNGVSPCEPNKLKSFLRMKPRASDAVGVGLLRQSAESGFVSAMQKVAAHVSRSINMRRLILWSLILWVLVACALLSVAARALPSCLAFGEARVAFPGKHLYWHGPAHCWNDSSRAMTFAPPSGRSPPRPRARPAPGELPVIPVRPDRPALPDTQTILFPALVPGPGTTSDMLNARPTTEWPLLVDVDAVTAEAEPVDYCCWPPLDEPSASFRERWFAMPTTWLGGEQRFEVLSAMLLP
jgi:hypothetical protein